MRILSLLFLFVILSSGTCNKGSENNVNPGFYLGEYELTYSVNNPEVTMNMPRKLTEISGLTYSTVKNILYCVNDEKGDIYGVSPISGEIIDKIDFAKSDDYEGIAYHDNMIYVAESNGNIKVVNEKLSERHVEYDDKLSSDNDIEGAVYNPVSNSLLLAAKGDSREDGNEKSEKALFSMNISNGEIDKKPFLTINIKEAIKALEKRYITGNAIVNLSVSSRIAEFAPSGVAIHPTTNELYILSARGKLLVVASLAGEVKAVVFLNQGLHVQPEGICFATDGTLFISNEGRGRSGKIYSYLQQK
ncbi:MAG: hypothetical protein ACJA1A_001429 [Saprospiraceae bacterium]|jgi:uncharacterized protein YjiK|tara:strand:- start:1520 stop:2431 length:912 start_codon:yes stop_codon:yes gene_type:complete